MVVVVVVSLKSIYENLGSVFDVNSCVCHWRCSMKLSQQSKLLHHHL